MIESKIYESSTATFEGSCPSEMPDRSDELGLIDLLVLLAGRKGLIAKTTGVFLVVGLIAALLQPVTYTATTRFMPPQKTQSAASMMMSQLSSVGGGALASMAGGELGMQNPNDLYLGLLTSRPVADAIIQKFDLKTVYKAQDMTAARKVLAGNSHIEAEKQGFISVSVTDSDRKRAPEIANYYVDGLRNLTKDMALSEASQRRQFYEEQLKQAKDALVTAEYSFEQIQQSKGLVQLDAQAKVMIESLSVLQAKVSAKEVELEAMRSYSTDQNPAVELAEHELASMKEEVAHMQQRSHSSGSHDLGLEDVPSAGLDYLRAERELKYRQALFEMLLKQYDAARIDEAKDAAIIQVVEPAIEPEHKSPQRRVLILILATFLGFFSGCFLALALWSKKRAEADPVLAGQIRKLKYALAFHIANRTP